MIRLAGISAAEWDAERVNDWKPPGDGLITVSVRWSAEIETVRVLGPEDSPPPLWNTIVALVKLVTEPLSLRPPPVLTTPVCAVPS
jgi:hypothetical protein